MEESENSGPSDISTDKDDMPSQPKSKAFKKTLMGGKNRSFNSQWYHKSKMIEYSKSTDKVYCFCCRHFPSGKVNSFVTGFSDWKNMSKKFEDHFNSKKSNHQFSLEKYLAYTNSKRRGSVVSQVSIQHKCDVIRNREILCSHVEVILLCAQQDIGLRGHRETDEEENRGNFIEILELLKQKCPDLAKKAESMPGNAKYVNHRIQNEIIEISGRLTLGMIRKEIDTGSECFSIIADESKDNGGIQQLSLCLRYLVKGAIVERFVGLMDLHKFDAKSITSAISGMIESMGLNITKCVAQAFDGASVMSGDITGVCKQIESQVGGITPYVHCYAHRLNLVLVDCCNSIGSVKEVLGLTQAVYNFQSQSVRRSEYFKESQKLLKYGKILEIPKSCDTRWSSQRNGISYFCNRLDSVMIALENIIEEGKSDEAAECRGYLNQLQSFRVLFIIVALNETLGHTNVLSEYLQYSELIYTRALTLCESTITTLSEMRNEVKFKELWDVTEKLAQTVFVEVPNQNDAPDTTKRKRVASKLLKDFQVSSTTGNRSTEIESIQQQLRAVFYEIIDRFIMEMKRRLVDNSEVLKGVSASDPQNKYFLDENIVVEFCSSFGRFNFDIPSLRAQLAVAKNLIKAEKLDRSLKCYEYLLAIPDGFPDLIKYFALVLTIPVSSATAERSFSTLNRVKSSFRTTMQEARTSNLTLLSINRDLSSNLRETPMLVVDEFAKNPDRRLTFVL